MPGQVRKIEIHAKQVFVVEDHSSALLARVEVKVARPDPLYLFVENKSDVEMTQILRRMNEHLGPNSLACSVE